MNRSLLLLALLASCQGHCNSHSAVTDEVEDSANCVVDTENDRAFCLTQRRELVECRLAGIAFKEAHCHLAGVVTVPQ